MIWLGIWLLAGIVVFVVDVWLNPDAYDTKGKDWAFHSVYERSALAVILWPVALLCFGLSALRRVLLRTKREKLKLRAELEKELAAAKREVEDLLQSTKK